MKTILLLLSLTLFSIFPLSAQEDTGQTPAASPAQDPYQQRLNELHAMNLAGEPLELMGANGTAFALYHPDTSSKYLGAVLLLHDQHNHLASQPLETLRLGLPRYGWETLAVQLPPKPAQNGLSWLEQSADLVESALTHLQGLGATNVVMIGHGSGALLALDTLFITPQQQVNGLIVISLDGHSHQEPRLDAARQLADVVVPILDIHAQHDHPRITASTERRAREAQRRPREGEHNKLRYRDISEDFTPDKGNRVHYRQLQISTADHTFHPNRETLLRTVRGWLLRHTQ